MQFIRNITQKELFKVTSLNSFSVIIKIAIGFVTSKFIAVFVGPAGMALVGNLRNFLTSLENMATLGFQNGIVKYVAEKESNGQELKNFLSTVVSCLTAITLVLSGCLYFFAGDLNAYLFGDHFQYQEIFKVFAVGLPWYVASVFLMSVLNGLGKYRNVIFINILGNILGLVLSVGLIYFYTTFGALLSVILAPSLLFFITVFFIRGELRFSGLFRVSGFKFSTISKLSEYSLMALVSSVLGPFVLLSIRNDVIDAAGMQQAGFWEAITRISSYYLLFLSTILGVYFLPRLSKAVDANDTKSIFYSYYKWIMPGFALMLVFLYVIRKFVIYMLFTEEFLPVSELFFWQLAGDFFKAGALILGYQFFAKKMTAAFITTEILSLAVLWISSHYFLSKYGIEGIVMAHAFTYAVYFCVLALFFRKRLF